MCIGESDGDPLSSLNCGITTLLFDGATVTNNGDGSATISMSGGTSCTNLWMLDGGNDLEPVTSTTCTDLLWDMDGNNDLMPVSTTGGTDTYFEEDGNNDLQPKT